MKTTLSVLGWTLLFAPSAMAQTADELANGAVDTGNVLNYGMGYSLQRFSPLTQINKDTVKRLVPVWNYSFDDNKSEQSQPIVYKGVIYVTTGSATMAVDAKTGKQIWKTKIEFPPETMRVACCGLSIAVPRSTTASYSAPRSTPMSSRSMRRPARNCGAPTRSTSRPDIQ